MSSIVDLSELAKYALANYWADQLFSGKIIVGSNNNPTIEDEFGHSAHYEDFLFPTSFPAYLTEPESSLKLQSGSLEELKLENQQWKDKGTDADPWYYRNLLMSMLRPASGDTKSLKLAAKKHLHYNHTHKYLSDPDGAGPFYSGFNYSFKNAPEKYNPEKYSPMLMVEWNVNDLKDENVQIGEDGVQIEAVTEDDVLKDDPNGYQSVVEFTYLPGSNSMELSFEETVEKTNKLTDKTTSGTREKSAEGEYKESEFAVSINTETDIFGTDVETSTDYSEVHKDLWLGVENVNFSEETSIEESSSLTIQVSGGVVDRFHRYTGNNFIDGNNQPFDERLEPGVTYEWAITFSEGQVQNNLNGVVRYDGPQDYAQFYDYGAAGKRDGDKRGDGIQFSMAQAFNIGDQYDVWGANQWEKPDFTFPTADPNDSTYVDVSSGSLATASMYAGISVVLSAKIDQESVEEIGASARRSGSRKIFDFNKHRPTKLIDRYSLKGRSSGSKIRDTFSRDFIQMGEGHDVVRLRGNWNGEEVGDVVRLGDGNDKLILTKAKGLNSIHAEAGDDHVVDSSLDTRADLGSGNDRYVFKGGSDMVTLGSGQDHFDVDAETADGTFVVSDFEVGPDWLTGLGAKAFLEWNPEGLHFAVQDSKSVGGRLHTGVAGNDPETWIALALHNPKVFGLKSEHGHLLDWQAIRDVYAIDGFNRRLNAPLPWLSFQKRKGMVKDAVAKIVNNGETVKGIKSLSAQSKQSLFGMAEDADSYGAFIRSVVMEADQLLG